MSFPSPKRSRRRALLRLLPVAATALVAAAVAPSHAVGATGIRHQEITNRADGGRLSAWDDNAANGVLAGTIRDPNANYEQRTSVQWEMEKQTDGNWVLRNEKNTTVCLQPISTAINSRVVLKNCSGARIQEWKLVPENHNLNSMGQTGWWSLRPVDNTHLAAAPEVTGHAYSAIKLYRAANSTDRLWHNANAGSDW